MKQYILFTKEELETLLAGDAVTMRDNNNEKITFALIEKTENIKEAMERIMKDDYKCVLPGSVSKFVKDSCISELK